jgi:beta-lactamase superfamily II metal-dependent hydrolase
MVRYFARIESDEPGNPEDSNTRTIILDAIRADWIGFATGPFRIDDNFQSADGAARAYWMRAFNGELDEPDPFEGAPIVRMEVTLAQDGGIPPLLRNRRRPWFEVDTEWLDGIAATVYVSGSKGLFDEEVGDTQLGQFRVAQAAQALAQIFDMQTWPNASETEVKGALSRTPAFSQLLAIDVGQGGANALIDPSGTPQLYFDVGAGMGRHAKTTPSALAFCLCESETIVLSHWDTDHWAGARADPRLLGLTWVVPRQRIGVSHSKLANDILRAGGHVRVYSLKTPIVVPLHWQTDRWGQRQYPADQWLALTPCVGKSRNDSGFALWVSDVARQLEWLLTGDASYDVIPPSAYGFPLAAVTASHHGARQPRVGSMVPQRRAAGYSKLLYSFATPNTFGHPNRKSVVDGESQGWRHGAFVARFDPTAGDVLATGFGDNFTDRGSVAAGWRERPRAPRHLDGCVASTVVIR